MLYWGKTLCCVCTASDDPSSRNSPAGHGTGIGWADYHFIPNLHTFQLLLYILFSVECLSLCLFFSLFLMNVNSCNFIFEKNEVLKEHRVQQSTKISVLSCSELSIYRGPVWKFC